MTKKLLKEQYSALIHDKKFEELIEITDQVFESQAVAIHLVSLACLNRFDEVDDYVFSNVKNLLDMPEFFEVMLQHVELYLTNGDVERAKKIYDKYQELPYINQQFEESLVSAKKSIDKYEAEMLKNKYRNNLSEDEIFEFLKSNDPEKITQALRQFEKLKIDPYMNEIKRILVDENLPFTARVLTLITLQDQNYDQPIQFNSQYNGHMINVIPSKLKMPVDPKHFEYYKDNLAQLKNPTFELAFKSYLEFWQLYRHPYEIDDGDATFFAILYKIYEEFGEDPNQVMLIAANHNVDLEKFHAIKDEISLLNNY